MSHYTTRLYRKLADEYIATIRPNLFNVQVGTVVYGDADIMSMKIIHGTTDPAPSATPSRAEIRIKGALPVMNDQNVYVTGAYFLSIAGRLNPSWRFSGRVTTQSVVQSAQGPYTIVQASSWAALAFNSDIAWQVGYGWGLSTLIGDLMSKLQRIFDGEVTYVSHQITNANKLYETQWTTIGQGIKKFLTDTGHFVFMSRWSQLRFRGPNELADSHLEAVAGNGGTVYPFERRQVLAPMDLEQTTENPHIGVRLKRRTSTGVLREGIWTFGEGWQEDNDLTVTEWSEVDWSHINWGDDTYRWAVNAEASRQFRTAFKSDTVKLDILTLLTSDNERDVTQAKCMVSLSTGDWVVFGKDWPKEYRGAKLVTGITETVSPDEWTIELSVHGPQNTIGRWGGVAAELEPMPTSYPWDRYERGFNTYQTERFTEMTGTFDQYEDLGD